MIQSLRAQLTLWSVGVLAVALTALSVGSYYAAERLLYRRLDGSLLSTLQETESALLRSAPTSPTATWVQQMLQEIKYPNRAIRILDADEHILATRKAANGPEIRFPATVPGAGNKPQFYQLEESKTDADDSCRGVFQRVDLRPGGASYWVIVGQSDEALMDQLDTLRDLAIFVVPLTLAFAAVGGWFLAHRSLVPIAAMATAAHQITARRLEDRLPVRNAKDEVGTLAVSFNELLDRLADALRQQRQFMADASHELRTPLSVARTAAEVLLSQPARSEVEYREALAIVRQQCVRLTRIVDGMFALARADMGQQPIHRQDVYLEEIVREAVRAVSVMGSQKEQRIETKLPEEAPYFGDEGLLRQMTLAVLDNAVKYTPRAGSIRVSLEEHAGNYEISVCDSGSGVPLEDQPHVFERFFRSAASANPGKPDGAGLGLAIARSIVELHGGEISLKKSDSSGSCFRIVLPRVS